MSWLSRLFGKRRESKKFDIFKELEDHKQRMERFAEINQVIDELTGLGLEGEEWDERFAKRMKELGL